ncbi:MAG: hypothetical protein ACXITR_06925 [Cyanobacterium sp.]
MNIKEITFLENIMILLKQMFKSLLTISLVLFISLTTVLGFMGGDSIASTLQMSPLNNQIAWGNENTEADQKNQEGKTEIEMEESQKLEKQSQYGVSNAIQNPDYKPQGEMGQVGKESRQGTKDIKAEANDAMGSNN